MEKPARKLSGSPVRIPSSRLPAPVITYLPEKNAWRLHEPYSYTLEGHRITIPAGFVFDLASVPRSLWWLIAPFELSIAAPLLHDFLYRYAGHPPAGTVTPPKVYTRREADRLFREVMEREGVAAWRRILAYLAVRWLGASEWGTA